MLSGCSKSNNYHNNVDNFNGECGSNNHNNFIGNSNHEKLIKIMIMI